MSAKDKILQALYDNCTNGLTKAQLMEQTGLKDSSVRGRLSELTFADLVRKSGAEHFVISPTGTNKVPGPSPFE